jgi:hypothetical protein
MDILKINHTVSAPDRLSFMILVAVCIFVNAPYFADGYFPVHDTLSVFQVFSYYYSELTMNQEIPWWLPHTSYGMPIDYHILFNFGPFQYPCIGGRIFGWNRKYPSSFFDIFGI